MASRSSLFRYLPPILVALAVVDPAFAAIDLPTLAPIGGRHLLIAFLLSLWLVGGAWAVAQFIIQRRRVRQLARWGQRLHAVLESTPNAWLAITNNDHVSGAATAYALLGRTPDIHSLAHLCALPGQGGGIVSADFAQLRQVIATIRQTDEPADLDIVAGNPPQTLNVHGALLPDAALGRGSIILWLHAESAMSTSKDENTASKVSSTAMLDLAPLPIWQETDAAHLIYANKAYAQAVDVTDGHEAVAQNLALVQTPLGSGRDITLTSTIIAGTKHTLAIHDVPLQTGMARYAIDVSEREGLRQALNRHNEAQRETLDRLSTPVAIFGAERQLLFHNGAFARLFRIDPLWLAAQPSYSDVLDAMRNNRRLHERADYQAWKQKELEQMAKLLDAREDMWHLPDDTTLRVVMQPHPLGGMLWLFEDVTARLVLERSYDTLIKVQQATLNNLHEGVALIQSSGHVRLTNNVLAALMNVEPEWLEGQPHIDHLLDRAAAQFREPSQRNHLRQQISNMVQGRQPISGELDKQDGRVVSYAGVPLPDGTALLTLIDVTDSKQTERTLAANNAALQAADELKTRFIANMSYELRTPLTSVIGFAEMLEQGYLGALTEPQRQSMRDILQSASRLDGLIGDLLELSRSDDSSLELTVAELDLAQIIHAAITEAKILHSGDPPSIRITNLQTAGKMMGDATRLRQAFVKLLVNALNYTPSGGNVAIIIKGDTVTVEVDIIDTGAGITPDELPHVFDRFFRGQAGAHVSGVGLGLSLAKQWIEAHNGKLTIQSTAGRGTSVHVLLPRAGGAAPISSSPAA